MNYATTKRPELVSTEPPRLIKPSDFQLISNNEIFNDFIKMVNDELIMCSQKEVYAPSASTSVTIYITNTLNKHVSKDMIKELIELYKAIGWEDVTYKYEEKYE